MSSKLPPAQVAANEERVVALMSAVDRFLSERREPEALRALREAEAIAPEHPLVLHEHGRRALVGGDPTAARALFERIVAIAPNHASFWLSLAAALRALTRRDEELVALERALALDPTHLVALLQKAAVLDLLGKRRVASRIYGNALSTLTPQMRLPPALEQHVQHARQRVAEGGAELGAFIESRIGELRRAHPRAEQRRFDRCVDHLLGRARIYSPQPTSTLFPFLRNFEFYDRERFPWLAALEAEMPAIREELLAVLAADQAGLEPYVAYRDGLPLNQWQELNNSRRWSAYFLWKVSERQEEHMARCPRTVAAVAATPQVHIPWCGPTAFFSILDAHTRIPPHTGTTNTRLTVHLPLVVPTGCQFRVGGDTRPWKVGEAWVFDDTIEHEAWNDSNVARAILLFDVWNPELTELERDLVRESTAALAGYFEAEGMRGVGL